MRIVLKMTCIAALAAALFGCGDGGSGGGERWMADTDVFNAGKATLAFSAMSTETLPTSLHGIDFTLTLPAGMSVTTASGNPAQISADTLTPSTRLAGTNLAFGTYSASTRKVHLIMATTNDTFRSGEFLRLSLTADPGTMITLGALKSINTPVTILHAGGITITGAPTTKDFPSKVKVTIGAVR